MYRQAEQEQEEQLEGYCRDPDEMKETWDEGDLAAAMLKTDWIQIQDEFFLSHFIVKKI